MVGWRERNKRRGRLPSGVGKTAAAWALANELGCDPVLGRRGRDPQRHAGRPRGRRPVAAHAPAADCSGSGWQVVIIDEADRTTPQAEVRWLDGLRMEKLPAKTVGVFTTNNRHKLTDRFVRR